MSTREEQMARLLEILSDERDALAVQMAALIAIVGAGLRERPVNREAIAEWSQELARRSSTINADEIMREVDAIVAGPRRTN